MANLTSANSIIMLSATGLFPVAQQMQGFSAEDIFEAEEIDAAETVMGVDGKLSGGLIYVEKPWWIHLQANSASNAFFDTLIQTQIASNDIIQLQGSVSLPGLGSKYALSNGILKRYPPMPAGHKLLQPRKFTIVWENIAPAPV